jgi:hypothetical protein
MAGRPRCAMCKKAFTPHPRNGTKITHRQRVCHDCGPVAGHMLATRRFRARKKESGRTTRQATAPSPPETGPQISPLAGELVRRIQQNCAALNVLMGNPDCVMASGHQTRIQ